MTKDILYDLNASILLDLDSTQLKLMREVLTAVKNKILSRTDDFERWDTRNPETLAKLLEEAQLGLVFKGTKLHDTLLNRPELYWTLLQLGSSAEDLTLFFHMLGVSENPATTLPIRKSKFYKTRPPKQGVNVCDISIDIDAKSATSSEELTAKLEAINIFSKLKMGVCIEYKVKLDINAVKSLLATNMQSRVTYKCITPMVQYVKEVETGFNLSAKPLTVRETYSLVVNPMSYRYIHKKIRESLDTRIATMSNERAIFKTAPLVFDE